MRPGGVEKFVRESGLLNSDQVGIGYIKDINAAVCIAAGEIVQQRGSHGRIIFFVIFVRRAGGGQIRPGGKGDDAARSGQSQRPKLQA